MGQWGNFSFKPPQAFSRGMSTVLAKEQVDEAGKQARICQSSQWLWLLTLCVPGKTLRPTPVFTHSIYPASPGGECHQHSHSPKKVTEDWSDWVSPVCGAEPGCEHHSYSRAQSPALLITSPPPVRDCSTAWGDVWTQLEIKLFLVFFSIFILLIYQFVFIYALWGRDTGVMAGSKPHCGCWKSNVGPLHGQHVLPAALQPFSLIFIKTISLEYTYKVIINMYCFPIN